MASTTVAPLTPFSPTDASNNKVVSHDLEDLTYGHTFRNVCGAIFSFIDWSTDIMCIVEFSKAGADAFATIHVTLCCLNLLFQWIVVIVQHKSLSRQTLLALFLTLLGLKPALDAYNVSTKQENKGAVFNVKTELQFTRAIEMFSETIPTVFVIMSALLNNKDYITVTTIGSLSFSALTAAFSSASLSYDMDTSEKQRKLNATFYGFIKKTKRHRSQMLFLLTLITIISLLSRCFALTLIAMVSAPLAFAFYGAEVSLFFLYKIVRGDVRYFANVEGPLSLPLSILVRIGDKIITDFTLLVQFRHPYECGGVMYMLSLVWSTLLPLIALQLFNQIDLPTTHPNSPLIDVALTPIAVGAVIAQIFSLVAFFSSMKRSHWNSFILGATGPQYTLDVFNSTEAADAQKIKYVFGKHRTYWEAGEAMLTTWVAKNYSDWRRAEWWNERIMMKIPENMIPLNDDKKKVSARLSERRHSGVGALLYVQ